MNPQNDQQNKNENQNSESSNVNMSNNNLNINNNNNSLNDIEILKKEILMLKKQHIQDEEKINKIKNDLQGEIDLLKHQVESLSIQLTELNEKKEKKNKNNINNINNINNENNSDSDEDMAIEQIYSIECLSNRLTKEISQGTERTNIEITIRNNSNKKYPRNTLLVCDNKNSLLLCDNVELNQLEPQQQQTVSVVFKNLKYISRGKYKCIIKLMVEKKIYNSIIELNIVVIDNRQNLNNQINNFQIPQSMPNNSFMNYNNIQGFNINNNNNDGVGDINQKIIEFKNQFNLYNNDNINDEIIETVLRGNNFDFVKSFEALFT